MKKLMIVAAALAMAASANAAATWWKVGASKILTTDNVAGSYYTGTGTITLFASLAGENAWFEVTDMTSDKEGTTPTSITMSSSNAGKITASENNFYSKLFTVGNNYDFYFTIEDGAYTFTSSTKSNIGAQDSAAKSIDFGNQETAGSKWSSVPEPTSGLLLLLGVAGLALRRRRA